MSSIHQGIFLLCSDTRGIVLSFLTYSDVLTMRSVSRYYKQQMDDPKLWKRLGRRDLPTYYINSREEYILYHWINVSPQKVSMLLSKNMWARLWSSHILTNRNGRNDHIVPSLVNSIMKGMEQVSILRRIKNRHPFRSMDWKIAIQALIEEILQQTEREKNELYDHAQSLQKYNEKFNAQEMIHRNI